MATTPSADYTVRLFHAGRAAHALGSGDLRRQRIAQAEGCRLRFRPAGQSRATKSACDDIRVIKLVEATALLRRAFETGMISVCDPDGLPKYAWAVDRHSEAYEAKLGQDGKYRGYRLGADDVDMRDWVLEEWEKREQ